MGKWKPPSSEKPLRTTPHTPPPGLGATGLIGARRQWAAGASAAGRSGGTSSRAGRTYGSTRPSRAGPTTPRPRASPTPPGSLSPPRIPDSRSTTRSRPVPRPPLLTICFCVLDRFCQSRFFVLLICFQLWQICFSLITFICRSLCS